MVAEIFKLQTPSNTFTSGMRETGVFTEGHTALFGLQPIEFNNYNDVGFAQGQINSLGNIVSLLNAVACSGVGNMSQTEQANRAFLSSVRSIPGVITFKPYGGKTLADQSIVVVVPALRTATSRQVFELEGAIFRSYPDARLEVSVIGLKERGLDVSQLATVLPK